MKIETVEIIIWILASKRTQPKTCVHLHFILQDKQRKVKVFHLLNKTIHS